MKRPDEVKLSREEGGALLERLAGNALTAEDWRVLVQLITFHFWLMYAVQEAQLSLKRLRAMLFGKQPKKRPRGASAGSSPSGGGAEETSAGTPAAGGEAAPAAADGGQGTAVGHRLGHGRQSSEAYAGAERVV